MVETKYKYKRTSVAFNEIDLKSFEKVKKGLPEKYHQRKGFAKFVHDTFDKAVEG